VVGVHLDESAIVDGVVDTAALNPVARLGGPADYSVLGEIFKMTRPAS
jgi:flavin reductase (DIM6/NTAB) family NADH-FMN oxidoreductase RutF